MIADIPCAVVSVYDGDTLTCANGVKIRLAGVDANEIRGKSCHAECAPMGAIEARNYVRMLTLGRRYTCKPLDRSYARIVATCSINGVDLGCILLRDGVAVKLDGYWRRYGMTPCR